VALLVVLPACAFGAAGDSGGQTGVRPAAQAQQTGTAATTRGTLSAERVLSLDTMHRVDIRVEPARLSLLDTDRSVRVPCEITIDGVRFAEAEIKEKGSAGSSSSLDGKPGFTVSFGKAHPAGLDKLTLNNALQDPSFLHEHLAYELYRRAGLPAPRTTHATVTLNGRPYGIYVLVEPVDEEFLARTFGANNDQGNLYEGSLRDFVEGPLDPAVIELKDEDKGRKRDDLKALADVVENTPDEQFASAIAERLDLPRFLTAYALDSVLAHWDGPMFNNNNYYLYAHPRDRRFVLLPHGADQVFDPAFDPLSPPKMRLAQRIRAIPALDAQLRAEMNRLVEQAWDVPALLDRIGRVAANVHAITSPPEVVARDIATFDATVESMRTQVVQRRAEWQPR
jgi:spore coat protein H